LKNNQVFLSFTFKVIFRRIISPWNAWQAAKKINTLKKTKLKLLWTFGLKAKSQMLFRLIPKQSYFVPIKGRIFSSSTWLWCRPCFSRPHQNFVANLWNAKLQIKQIWNIEMFTNNNVFPLIHYTQFVIKIKLLWAQLQ
jgi:hypothetical protein